MRLDVAGCPSRETCVHVPLTPLGNDGGPCPRLSRSLPAPFYFLQASLRLSYLRPLPPLCHQRKGQDWPQCTGPGPAAPASVSTRIVKAGLARSTGGRTVHLRLPRSCWEGAPTVQQFLGEANETSPASSLPHSTAHP